MRVVTSMKAWVYMVVVMGGDGARDMGVSEMLFRRWALMGEMSFW